MIRRHPLRSGTFTVSSGFGPRWGTHHLGLDFAADDGTPFYAAQAGTIKYIGAAQGFGQWIVLDHSDTEGGGCTVYGHMWDAHATGLHAGDHVEAGQLLGYVGANGEATGPHLHFEVHPVSWSAGSQLDPEPWLANVLHPDDPAPTSVSEAPASNTETSGAARTWFGIDISGWQAGIDMARVAADGIHYVLGKATEGADYRSPEYTAQKNAALANGMLWGAYHYVRPGDPQAQVDNFEAVEPDKSVPVMLDHEDGSGDISVLRAVHDAFTRRGHVVNLAYLPNWYWSGHIGSPTLTGLPPLMSSNYPSKQQAGVRELYPGDDHTGWDSYGGNRVAVYQFAETGQVAGKSVDVNAFKGTSADLHRLFNLEGDDMPYSEEQLKRIIFDCLEIYCGPIVSDVKDLRENLLGARDDTGGTPGKPCGGGRPLYELTAAVAAKTGVDATSDPKQH